MAGIYDIHCHLNDTIYLEQDLTSMDIVNEAAKAGVTLINSVGFDIKSSKLAVLQAQKNNGVYAVVGIHPTQAQFFTDVAYEQLEDLANANKIVAIGETGLDYSRTEKYVVEQKHWFSRQIELAKKYHKPLMIHIKDKPGSYKAYHDVLEMLLGYNVKDAVVHSFEGTLAIAEQFIDAGYYISVNGLVTIDKTMQEVAKNISLNKLMVESDAPYNSPHPYEKKLNHPKFTAISIDKIASLRNIGKEEIISATHENAQRLFKN